MKKETETMGPNRLTGQGLKDQRLKGQRLTGQRLKGPRLKGRPALLALGTAIISGAALLAVADGLIAQSQAQAGWRFDVIGAGIKPAIAVDGDGNAHVAYLRETLSAAAYYASNASGAWVTQTASKGYFYGPVDIDVGPGGRAFITYHDHEGSSFSPQLGSGVVLTVDGNNISRTKIDHPGHDQWDADIAIDTNSNWHVAGIDPSQFASAEGLEYATNAFGDVVVENVGSGPLPYEFGVSIEIADDGQIGISYFNDVAGALIFAERSAGPNGTWQLTTVDAEGRAGRYSDLAFDSQGNPHISYWVFDAPTSGRVRYAHRGPDNDWRFEDVGTLDNVVVGFAGARKITAIELDSTGQPHVMFGDMDVISYAQKMASGWSEQTVAVRGDAPLGQLVEFDLDTSGRPHLVYFEALGTETGLPSLAGRVIYATPDSQ